MNKNTRRIAALKRIAILNGGDSVTFRVPVFNYHSNGQPREKSLVDKTILVFSGAGVVSSAPRRNMQMRVYQNQNPNGTSTAHEPINKADYVTFKNIGWVREKIGYKQPPRATVAS